ncbi:outer membrane protein assembly factor BamE [Pelomonas cellulosilytica]|uniref:Outer membrane protein assembly factor BamE n=1 Tax=Pelomonas cellulosilytica TaxID=2906762 RepID=A0ABS8XYC0_9BURK|nr:outer membrane protein assembly factor BamE [Pelomonas sp. P8]MCE4557636.1 outer membrane protein assembly factor BamE [Pelomonas sp. P8]
MRFALSALAFALLVAGCATPDRDTRLRPGVSRGAEIVEIYGRPRRVWPEADGGRTLEYSSQPMGHHTYMVRLDAQDRLVRIEDALSPAGRARVEPGMTPEQVSRLLGAERSRVFFRLSGEDVWDWSIEPDQVGYGMRFNVYFKDGHVVRTGLSMVFPSRVFPGADD